ncbi:MAG: FkbM family methyltransferase [Patescibacteria group bacterium]|jgi:FkbM family methyltransferase
MLKNIKKTIIYNIFVNLVYRIVYRPKWHTIKRGVLLNNKLFISNTGIWREMISGNYDDFFADYFKKNSIIGKTIYDVGAHIGYSSMLFAKLVGPMGKVFSFEPSIFNKKRFELILKKNKELGEIIKIYEIAISDKVGEDAFIFNSNVDSSKSSGSFIEKSHTFFEKKIYENSMGFKRSKVKTINLDSLHLIGISDKPDIIKIDIEGAEFLALRGGMQTLLKYKPILLIEVHSIFNMHQLCEILFNINYKIKILKEESDGRCFISAHP